MLIVGELINASRKAVAEAIKERNGETIQTLAADQHENGAAYIDVNAGIFVDDEADHLKWLVETIQAKLAAPCCIDSPNPAAIETALAVHEGQAMINSISLEKERLDKMLPIVAGTNVKVVALCMSDDGMPETADDRVAIADKLINTLVQNNVALDNIYVDPLVQPVSTNTAYGREFLSAIERIMQTYSGCHTICGLSNISFGLPMRKLLNRTFVAMAIAKGLDAAIINPLDNAMISSVISAAALIGQDNFCMNYIKAYRDGRFA